MTTSTAPTARSWSTLTFADLAQLAFLNGRASADFIASISFEKLGWSQLDSLLRDDLWALFDSGQLTLDTSASSAPDTSCRRCGGTDRNGRCSRDLGRTTTAAAA